MNHKMNPNTFWPKLGCGVGLRTEHYPKITSDWPAMDFFEALTENYMNTGGRPLKILEEIRRHYPLILHGVALSIGSIDPLNQDYLRRLKTLVDRIEPVLVSDHLCWSGVGGHVLHDLLPLPFTKETVGHVIRRVDQVQSFLKRPILLENVSTYVTFRHSTMPEWEFLKQVALRSGCGILLDVNNIYVNSVNHGFDPYGYLEPIPARLIGQIHLAGHTPMGKFLFDTHSSQVTKEVWDLYQKALQLYGKISTLIEWDEEIPSFERLSAEADKARNYYAKACEYPAENLYVSTDFEMTSKSAEGGPPLEQVQQRIKGWIEPLEQAQKAAAGTADFLNPQAGDPGVERMEVYASGYKARTHAALSETFAALHAFLGDADFERLCVEYVSVYPSWAYDLSRIGASLPEFLQKHELQRQYPFLRDLAEFEWKVNLAFHAFDTAPARTQPLAAFQPESWELLQILFQSSVVLFESRWPILGLWNARLQPLREKACTLLPVSERILISRRDNQIRTEVLTDPQYRLIQGLMSGELLGSVCEVLAEANPEVDIPIAQWFSAWLQDGLIREVSISVHA